VLSNARTNPKTRCKIGETQAEIKLLLQIPAVNLNVEDDRLFSRNCALFGKFVVFKVLRQQWENSCPKGIFRQIGDLIYDQLRRCFWLAGSEIYTTD
jgi:hypothetical protein